MPRDRSDWNTSIGKDINTLLNRQPGPSLTGSVDASASVLQTSNLAESTQSTSKSLASSQATNRTREHLQRFLLQSEDYEHVGYTPDTMVLEYIGRIEQYSNHKLSESLTPYRLNYLGWQKVCLAAQAAKDVHKMARTSGDALFVPGSTSGTIKSFATFKHTLDGAQYLVVAIRATRIIWDWMVNFNSEPAECTELGNKFKCHKGFRLVARNMKASIENRIKEHISTHGQPTNIIFAGHSAGAAVAQLLFSLIHSNRIVDTGQQKHLEYLLMQLIVVKQLDPNIGQIDCITFGGPPATFPPMPSLPPCLFLNIKNEGDPATLAQPDYIESLLHAYVLKPTRTNSVWKVPCPFYYSSGDQIILRDVAEEDSDVEDPAAFQVNHDEVNSVISGNPLQHSMTLYLTRVATIRDRCFNSNLF